MSGRSDAEEMELRLLLAEAVDDAATVTLVFDDGATATGVLKMHPTIPDVLALHTGGRGRPRHIHPMDLAEVSYE